MNAVGGRALLNAVDDGGDSVVTGSLAGIERRREPSVTDFIASSRARFQRELLSHTIFTRERT
jgi:hypothetical protein